MHAAYYIILWLHAVIFQAEDITFTGFRIEITMNIEKHALALLAKLSNDKNINSVDSNATKWDYKILYAKNRYFYTLTTPYGIDNSRHRHAFIRKWLSRQKELQQIHFIPEPQCTISGNFASKLNFSIRSPSLQELFQTSKRSLLFPEKSTYFYPKPSPQLMRFIKESTI